MYHYVRRINNSRYPGIKGLELKDFIEQIKYLKRHYNIVTMEEVIGASQGDEQLPVNSALLTFDDGYAEHFSHVYPVLKKHQLQGSFSMASPPQKHSWAVIIMAGQDEAAEDENEFNGKVYQGITLQSTNLWGNRISYYGVLSAVESEYDEINESLFSKLREDTSITLVAGWRYSYNAQLGFRNDYSFNDVDSTLEANTYRRSKVEFGMSYRF